MKTPLHLAGLGLLLTATVIPAAASRLDEYPTPAAVPGNQDLNGSGAVLKKLLPKAAATPAPKQMEGAEAVLRRDLAAFRDKNATLPPEQAARGWLALADRAYALRGNMSEQRPQGSFSFVEVVKVLPPPNTWTALSHAIAARQPYKTKSPRDLSYILLAHVLTAKSAEQAKDVKVLGPVLSRKMGGLTGGHDVTTELQKMINFQSGENAMGSGWGSGEGYSPVVPDLVTLYGRSAATARLRQLLVNSRLQLNIPLGEETRQLAQQLALELAPKLRVPQWTLAQSISATRLFEALEKRFANGPKPPRSEAYKTARIYYVLGLVTSNRVDEATNRVLGLTKGGVVAVPPEAFDELNRKGHARAVNNFLRNLLTRRPDLPFWSTYITVAANSGQSEEMLAVIRKAAGRKGLSGERLLVIRDYLYRALLAADRVDEGGAVLRQLLATATRDGDKQRRHELGIVLARVGRATNRPAWVTEGVKAVRASMPLTTDFDGISEVITLLVETRRDAEAEKELTNFLYRSTRNESPEGEEFDFSSMEEGNSSRTALTNLAGIYHRRGQHAAVLELLEKAPWWGAADLSEAYASTDVTGTPLGQMAAAALAAAGRKDEAIAILKTLLNTFGGYDPAYELLIQLQGEQSIPTLDALFARDRFEERPLIWKAELLRRAGKLDEAEKLVRQAITIDPSDGEQGKGTRMRVYAVLAHILRDKGDKDQADDMQAAVTAIRMSEDADSVYAAGLLTRAIKMYERSLVIFANAYCIQSRVAVRLAQAGRTQEATEHYKRAFELMPDSFGRMESHCFGCEGAFQGARAEGIAERVFKQGLAKTPNKPQLHYLLGYLREEQNRYREAVQNFRRATQLDRDYINAWSKMVEVGTYMYLPAADRNAAALNLIRLDPVGRHVQVDYTRVTNLAGLWRAQAEARAKWRTIDLPEKLLPLPASAPEAGKIAAKRKAALAQYGMSEGDFGEIAQYYITGKKPLAVKTPGEVIASQSVVAMLAQVIDALRMYETMSANGPNWTFEA